MFKKLPAMHVQGIYIWHMVHCLIISRAPPSVKMGLMNSNLQMQYTAALVYNKPTKLRTHL